MNLLLDQLDTRALESLMTRDMDRKQFLLYMGGVVVGLIGIKSLVDNVLHQGKPKHHSQVVSGAYGGGSYAAKDSQRPLGGTR